MLGPAGVIHCQLTIQYDVVVYVYSGLQLICHVTASYTTYHDLKGERVRTRHRDVGKTTSCLGNLDFFKKNTLKMILYLTVHCVRNSSDSRNEYSYF